MERKFDSCIGDQEMQRWRSGPTHGIANPKNRQFESDPLLQQEKIKNYETSKQYSKYGPN